MKRKDSILLKYYSNKLPKHQMTGQVDYKKRQEENLQKSVDFLKDWYTKRATLPQFKNVSERRLNVLEQPIETRYWDPEILKAMGYSGGYSPRKKVLTLPDPNPSFADFPEYEKYMQHSTGSPLFMHELFHKLHYEAPQFTDVVPEKITEKIPGYPELTSPEYISLSTGKIKTGFGKASTFYPEMEGITAMLRQAETIDPLKPVTPDDVNSYIKKYNKYNREIKLRDVDLDQSEDFHRGRLIKQLFDVLGNDPEKIAAYLNSVAKNDNQQDLSLAKWGGLTKYQIKGQVDNSRKPYLPYRVDYIDPRTGKPTSKFYESAEDADYFLNHGALKLVGPQGVQGYYEKPPRKKEVQVSPEEQARLNKQKAIEDTTKSFLEKWYNSPMHREMLKSSLNRGLGLFLDKRTDKMTQDRLKTLPGIKVNVAKMPEAIFDFSDISTLGYVDKDNPSLININAFSTVDDAKGTGVHEGSHLADYAAGIPMKDVKRMRRAASAPTDEYGEYMVGDKSGTETKARIYGGRYELEKAGIYNPFTEKLSKENFEKAEREIPEFKRTNDELRSIYSTDDILNFYNTISKSDNTQSQTMARYGFSVQSKQKALPKHQSIGEVTGKNCVGQCWKPTLSDKSGNSGGMFVGNTPISWSELLKYNEVDTKDKQFKKYLKDLQSKFPGLTKDQLLAAGADSSRIKGRIGDLVTWDKPENQTYDRAWYPFYRSLMQPNVRVTIPQILEFQSQQPGGLGGYQQVVESNYGKKKLRNGGVINMYGPGGATTDGCPAGYDKHPLTGECMPNGWVAPMQAGPTVQNAERLRRAAALNRGTIGPTIGQSRSDEPWRQRQAAEIRRRNAQQNSALAQTMGSFTPSGYNPAAGVIGANTQLIATAVPVVASAIGAAAPYVASALEAPLLGTLGASYGTGALTTGNLINAGFAYHGAKNLPNVAAAWRDVANKPTLSGVGNALGQTALTAIDILPFASTAFKGIPSVMQDINKLKSFRSKTPTSISKEILELNMTDEELANAIAEIEKNRVNSILGSNNELPPPPAEIRINPDGTYEQIPFGEPFAMSYEEYKNSLNKIKIKNRSGFDKDEILNLTSGKDKDVISKMSDREFENTVLKPTGEIVEYKPGVTIKDMVYDPDTRRMVHKNQSILSEQEYENLFNENLDLLNEIIAKNNKSGLQYKVKELKNGILTFETPEQEIENVLTDAQKNNISLFQSNPKKYLLDRSLIKKEGDVWKLDEFDDMTFNSIEEAINFSKDQMKQALAPRKISGTSVWSVNPNPGRWSGEVEDIPNKEYFTSIPGLSISSSSSSVFPDFPRRGTRAYESLNEYLKAINLGRVKAGFNSQTNYSKGLWEDAIKKGKAFGYYRRPDVIYGIMKKQGGSINKYGILPKHQIKGQVQPTTADSLEVYNNAVAIRNYYDNLKKKGWYREPKVTNLSGLDKDSFKARMDYVKEKSLRTYRELLKRKKPSGGIFSNDKRHIEFDYFKNVYPNATYDDYIKAVGKSLVQTKAGTGDKYYYKDLFPSVIDPMAPSTLVNLKILPNEELRYSMHPNGDITYTTPPGGPFTGLYTYNPLSVKPAYLRSKQEEDEWQKKYGKSKIQTSKIQTSTTQKQKPQTPKPEEPKLKRKVSMMSPISTQSSSLSLKLPNIPNIQMSGAVPQGKYRVEYYDPELKQETHRNFMTQAESDAFTNELSKRNLSGVPSAGNITQRVQYRDGGLVKYQKKGEVKKSPITHYIFAEQDSDNAFQTEANNLKTFISKNYPGENVVILPGRGDDYFNKTVLPTLGKVGKQDRVYLFGHHGSKYAGVPASLWGNAFEQAQKRAGDFNCYLGSCGASDLAGTDPDDWSIGNIDPAFSRLKNFYYRPETIDTRENSGWYGVNPNAQAVPGNSQFGVLNAMYTRSANNPNASKIRDARMNYIDSFYNKDKEYASLNKQAEQLSNQILKDPKNENIKKRLSETFEKMWYRRDTLGRLLDKDRQFIALMKQEEEASKPYIVESPRYGVDFARSTFNPYVNVDRRQEHLKKKREIDTRTLNTNFLSNPFPMFAQGGQRFYGVPRFDEGGTPMCKDSFGNPIPCPPGYTAGSMVFATATPAAQDNTRLPKRIEMTDKAAQAKAVSDAHAFNKAWMNSPMYNQMLQASIAASPSSSLDIPNTRKFAADPSRIDVQIEDLNNPDLGGTTSSQPTDPTKVSQIKLNPNSHFPFRDVAGHEILGHATDANGILIPQADKDKMNKYFTPVNNTKDPIAELAKGNNISYAEQKAWVDEKIKNDPQFAKDWKKLTELGVDITNITNEDNKYIQRPTETRARLMSVRKIAKERGVYDPLTQKMTRENLRKLKELDNDDLNSLFRNYTEDELLDMFNTISMNDSSDTQTMARWGGSLKKRSQGGMIEDDMGQLKYPGFPTRIRSKNITMEGVNHPLVAKTNRGITKLLLPNMKYEFEPMTQFVDEHPVPMIPQISNQTPRVMRNFGGEEPPQYINLSLPKMDQKRKKVEINPYIYYERPNPFVNVMGAGFQGNARLNNRWDLTGGMNVGRVNIPTENFSQYLKPNYNIGLGYRFSKGGQHGGLDRWFAEKWVDVKTGKACGRQEGENRAYPACRPSKRVSSQTPKTSSEMSSSEKAKFKSVKQSSQRIPYNHKRR